jgi:hypothetical protein
MPSPFPGMDPYLEGPRLWRDLHTRLISEIQETLNRQFGDQYVARIEERVYISDVGDPGRSAIIPDVHVAATGPAGNRAAADAPGIKGVVGAIEVVELIDEEVHEPYVEILDLASRAVVTVIEVLSLTNKIEGSRGREEYMAKRERVLKSRTHLVEVDLLRDGRPVFVGQALPRHDYMAVVSRFQERRRRIVVWPILLRQRLPVIPIPLRAADADVELDLQGVLNQSYERGKYQVDVNYREGPDVPLSLEAGRWADELLRSKGLRQ